MSTFTYTRTLAPAELRVGLTLAAVLLLTACGNHPANHKTRKYCRNAAGYLMNNSHTFSLHFISKRIQPMLEYVR
jgi:hypothetical protein